MEDDNEKLKHLITKKSESLFNSSLIIGPNLTRANPEINGLNFKLKIPIIDSLGRPVREVSEEALMIKDETSFNTFFSLFKKSLDSSYSIRKANKNELQHLWEIIPYDDLSLNTYVLKCDKTNIKYIMELTNEFKLKWIDIL